MHSSPDLSDPRIVVEQGVEDEIVPYAQGQALASALGAELLTLEGAGHNNVLSNPHWARFANRLQGFLRECRAK